MSKQIIYFGAPGTGKSHLVDEETEGTRKFRVTIHPEYTYSDFVGQILPVETENGEPRFEFVPGQFTRSLAAAFADRKKAGKVSLILEELSRGNVAAIFGDMFQLLDRKEDGSSEYPISNKNVADQIRETEEWVKGLVPRDHVFLPENLSIYATVNLNDQNVVPMDTAFKRRFEWRYVSVKPVPEKPPYANNPIVRIRGSKSSEYEWADFYQALDGMIVSKKGLARNEDRQIGQFFLRFDQQDICDSNGPDSPEKDAALDRIDDLMRNKLLMYLWQDVQGRSYAGDGAATLFKADIASFQDLYEKSERGDVIFSDLFLNTFLG